MFNHINLFGYSIFYATEKEIGIKAGIIRSEGFGCFSNDLKISYHSIYGFSVFQIFVCHFASIIVSSILSISDTSTKNLIFSFQA